MTTSAETSESLAVRFPDSETVRAALALAIRAPSVHNSQPWHWKIGAESLHLYADRSRHLPVIDSDRRDMLISCGMALHHAVVGLAALGWRAKVHRIPDPANPDHLASLELVPQEPTSADIALAAAIPQRRTDRRHYSFWPVSLSDIATMGARVARMGIVMRRVEMSIDIRAIVEEAVRRHRNDPAYLAEIAEWTGRHASPVGIPERNIPESDPAARLPGRLFAGAGLSQPPHTPALQDRGVLLALGTAADDDVARLRAGEASSLLLLTATSCGLASCPVSEPLEVGETRDEVREEVFGGQQYPQMMFRVGWAAVGAEPLPSTPRLPLDAVVSTLEA